MAQRLDTLQTVTNDSLQISQNQSGFESPVYYFGEAIRSFKNEKGERLSEYKGKAKIIYQDMKITAYKITVNQATKKLIAEARVDSSNPNRITVSESPIFTQAGNEPMHGFSMTYDFATKRGKVNEGHTRFNTARYEGNEIKKIGEDIIFIRDGRFTTCDADSPNYWFHSDNIKMEYGEMIYTGPVFMHVYDIPFPIPLPFGIFSMKKGRRSGVIIPKFDFQSSAGRGLRDLGYYWAASEQFEAKFLLDYHEESNLIYKLNLAHRDRYDYRVNVDMNYSQKDQYTLQDKESFVFNYNYIQQIDPSFSISGSGNYSSSISNSRFFRDFKNQSNQLMTSNMNFNKSWDNGARLSGYINYTENLITKAQSYTLPSLNFSIRSGHLFGNGLTKDSWVEYIQYNYSSSLSHIWKRSSNYVDSTQSYVTDNGSRTKTIDHKASLSAPFKVFKYFNFNPAFNYNEKWLDEVSAIETINDSSVFVKKPRFGSLRTFGLSASLNTNMFGLIDIERFGIRTLRHKFSPSVSIVYQPNFSDPFFGNSILVPTGKYNKEATFLGKDGNRYIDKFGGLTPRNESLNAQIGIANSYSIKRKSTGKHDDEKIDLLQSSSGISHNFLAEKFPWSDINSSFNFPFIQTVSFNGSMTHSIYELDEQGNRLDNYVDFLPLLKSLNLTIGYSMNDKLTELLVQDSVTAEYNDVPFQLSVNASYVYNAYPKTAQTNNFSGGFQSSFHLTKKWFFSYASNINFLDWEVQYQSLSITRDLECWNFAFNYSPNKFNSYFSLTISIKEDMLKDLRYERRSRNFPIY